MSIKHEVNRRLSPMEKYFWILDRVCRTNFIMHARVRGVLNEKIMRRALNAIQARHPLLRVRIERVGWNNLRFCSDRVPEIPLRVADALPGEWTREAEKDLNAIFSTRMGPLVRATLVRHDTDSSTALLTFHHSIGDGMSGAYLMRDLIGSAALASTDEDPGLPLLEPTKELDTYFPPWARGFSGRWKNMAFGVRTFAPMLYWGRPTVPVFDRKAPFEQRKACILARTLSPETVGALHETARTNGTTLHGALLAAQVLAIARDRGLTEKRPFFVGSPVNLRSRLTPPVEEDVGFFVTMGVSINRCNADSEFWPLAREIRQSLWNCVERGDPFVFRYQQKDLSRISALTGIGPLGAKTYATLSSKLSAGGMGFSNIGRVSIEAVKGPFKIESLGFAASGSTFSPFVTFGATIESLTTWNFVGMEPLMGREHTRKIADLAVKILKEAI
jgi:Phthiocerol/phthiodiolone dimycocerosyl transferase C-terminus/Condensation domain